MKKNIKLAILIPVLLISTIGILGTSMFLYLYNTKKIEDKANQEYLNYAKTIAERIDATFLSIEKTTELNALYLDNNKGLLPEEQVELITKSLTASNKNIVGAGFWWDYYKFSADKKYFLKYFLNDSGTLKNISSDYENGNLDYQKESWFKIVENSKKTSETKWTNPYYDSVSKIDMVTNSAPILSYNKVIGVITADVSLSNIKKIVSEVKIGDSGYAFLTYGELGNFISHPTFKINENISNTNEGKYKDLLLKAQENEKISLIKYHGQVEKFISVKVPTTGWTLTFYIPNDELNALKYNNLLISLTSVVIISILMFLLLFFIINRITKPISTLTTVSEEVAKGNFNINIEKKLFTRKDELGGFALSFNNISNSISSLIGSVINTVHSVSIATVDINSQMKEVSSGAQKQLGLKITLSENFEEIDSKMAGIIDEVRTQVASVEEISATITQMSGSIDNVAKRADLTMKISQDAATSAKEGVDIIHKALLSMNEFDEITEKIVTGVNGIFEISTRTNLLALNAAIEAARAGENGRGFSVVAEEVKKLAETSKKFTETISSLVEELKIKTKINVELSKQTGMKLSEIDEKVSLTNMEIKEVSQIMIEQATATNEVAEAVSNLANASSEIEMKAISQVESINIGQEALNRINDVIDNTASSSKITLETLSKLNELVDSLKKEIDVFKLKK